MFSMRNLNTCKKPAPDSCSAIASTTNSTTTTNNLTTTTNNNDNQDNTIAKTTPQIARSDFFDYLYDSYENGNDQFTLREYSVGTEEVFKWDFHHANLNFEAFN
eukprot:Pgem_evm1s4748